MLPQTDKSIEPVKVRRRATKHVPCNRRKDRTEPQTVSRQSTHLEPSDRDILGGRGKAHEQHPGRIFFRSEVDSFHKSYDEADIKKKKQIVRHIYNEITVKQGRRFMEEVKDGSGTSSWILVDENVAMKKIRQRLRDAFLKTKPNFSGIKVVKERRTHPQVAIVHEPAADSVISAPSDVDLTHQPLVPVIAVLSISKSQRTVESQGLSAVCQGPTSPGCPQDLLLRPDLVAPSLALEVQKSMDPLAIVSSTVYQQPSSMMPHRNPSVEVLNMYYDSVRRRILSGIGARRTMLHQHHSG